MPATEAQNATSRAHAATPTPKKSPESPDAGSSRPTVKLLPEREAEEVQRRTEVYVSELNPSGELGVFLCRLAAIMSTRIERCQLHDIAIQTERVRKAIAAIEYPAGIDPVGAAKLRDEASQKAVFDPSPEATLARKYMLSAERSFFRALKELRTVERDQQRMEAELFGDELGSNSPDMMTDEEFDARYPESTATTPRRAVDPARPIDFPIATRHVDVPIAIGKPR